MFRLKIVTPDRVALDQEVKRIVVRGVEGDLAVMKGTQPLVTPTKISNLRITLEDGNIMTAAIGEGYLSIEKDMTVLAVETAEWEDEIDVERAVAAKVRAEKRLSKHGDEDIDLLRAELALARAVNRLKVAKKY